MTTATATPVIKASVHISDSKLIAMHLLDGLKPTQQVTEIKALTAADRAALGCGIRNGSWTYDD